MLYIFIKQTCFIAEINDKRIYKMKKIYISSVAGP